MNKTKKGINKKALKYSLAAGLGLAAVSAITVPVLVSCSSTKVQPEEPKKEEKTTPVTPTTPPVPNAFNESSFYAQLASITNPASLKGNDSLETSKLINAAVVNALEVAGVSTASAKSAFTQSVTYDSGFLNGVIFWTTNVPTGVFNNQIILNNAPTGITGTLDQTKFDKIISENNNSSDFDAKNLNNTIVSALEASGLTKLSAQSVDTSGLSYANGSLSGSLKWSENAPSGMSESGLSLNNLSTGYGGVFNPLTFDSVINGNTNATEFDSTNLENTVRKALEASGVTPAGAKAADLSKVTYSNGVLSGSITWPESSVNVPTGASNITTKGVSNWEIKLGNIETGTFTGKTLNVALFTVFLGQKHTQFYKFATQSELAPLLTGWLKNAGLDVNLTPANITSPNFTGSMSMTISVGTAFKLSDDTYTPSWLTFDTQKGIIKITNMPTN